MKSKAQIRAAFRLKRASTPAAQIERCNRAIAERLLAEESVQRASTILSYLSFGGEVDTRDALRELIEQGKAVIVPPVDAALDALDCFHFLAPNDPLLDQAKAPAERIPETCSTLQLAQVGVYIVPAIAWDERGYRIGYGGGYFDRLLARAAPGAVKIGLGFGLQIADELPVDEWDVPVDVILTQSRRIECRR